MNTNLNCARGRRGGAGGDLGGHRLSSDARCNPPADLISARLIKTLGSVAMPAYSHLLDEERDQIAVMRAAGRSICAIAGDFSR
jgi:hypothetical protein